MNFLNYLGIVSLIMQVMFIIFMIILAKRGHKFNHITIGIFRLVISALILSVIISCVFFYTHKPKKVVYNRQLTKQELVAIVERQAIRYGVPLSIARSLVQQESQWNPRAVSRKQACGLCQVLPSTFVAYTDATDIFNPTINATVGMKYLAHLYKIEGKWDIALAKYNGGNKYYNSIESRNYVACIMSRVEYR